MPSRRYARAVVAFTVAVASGVVPHEAGAFDLGQGSRALSVNGYVQGDGILRVDRDTPQQHVGGQLLLQLAASPHQRLHVFLETRSMIGGPILHRDGAGIVNLSDTFQNDSPSLEFEEGYVDLELPGVGVRAGKQKFAWGKLDSVQPTDVLNPRRFQDPFLTEEADAKIGVPALRITPKLPDSLGLELVWLPVPIAARFPRPGERWFPPESGAPTFLVIPGNAIQPGLPTSTIRNAFSAKENRPSRQLDEGAGAVRLWGVHHSVDWSLCFYDGPEPNPAFDLDVNVFSPSARRKLADGLPTSLDDLQRLAGTSTLTPRFGRIRLWGGDAATSFGGFTARVEAAYSQDRLLPRSVNDLVSVENIARHVGPRLGPLVDRLLAGRTARVDLGPLSVVRDVADWGAGVDYDYGGWFVLVQLNQTVVLDNNRDLLVPDIDTRVLGSVRRTFLGDRLELQLNAVQGFARGFTLGLPRVTYSITDSLRVRLGFLFIAGARRTLIGQFHDNDEAFLQLRYSF
jgi:hypothetical protein